MNLQEYKNHISMNLVDNQKVVYFMVEFFDTLMNEIHTFDSRGKEIAIAMNDELDALIKEYTHKPNKEV